jgi:hypothetical protein
MDPSPSRPAPIVCTCVVRQRDHVPVEVRTWVRDLYDCLEPFATGGTYVNYAGGEERGGARSAYGDGAGGRAWDRLVEL